jgi:hypothetical protein
VIAAALAVVLCAGVAGATKLLPVSLPELKARAAVIAEVEAVALTVEERDGVPFTLVDCRVRRAFKGKPGDSLTLRTPGGKRGELTMIIPGAPLPEKGDVFIAFLEDDGNALGHGRVYRSIGLGQGMFALVERDGKTWAVQTMGAAPKLFAECREAADVCASRLSVVVRPLADFAAELSQP